MTRGALIDAAPSWSEVQVYAALGAAAGAVLLSVRRQPVAAMRLGAAATAITYQALARHRTALEPGTNANHHTRDALGGTRGIHLRESIRLERPVEEVFQLLASAAEPPEVHAPPRAGKRDRRSLSHWVARGPAGVRVEWDAEIINEVPNRLIGWRSVPGSDVTSAGSVQFAKARNGLSTQITVHMQYAAAGRQGRRVPGDDVRPVPVGSRARRLAAVQAVSGGRRVCDGHAFGTRGGVMKAVRYYGKEDVRVERLPDLTILNPRDAVVKVTTTAICGSDLHIYGGYIPTMQRGDILGHEFMGEVVEVGRGCGQPEGWRPGSGAVCHRLRKLLLL